MARLSRLRWNHSPPTLTPSEALDVCTTELDPVADLLRNRDWMEALGGSIMTARFMREGDNQPVTASRAVHASSEIDHCPAGLPLESQQVLFARALAHRPIAESIPSGTRRHPTAHPDARPAAPQWSSASTPVQGTGGRRRRSLAKPIELGELAQGIFTTLGIGLVLLDERGSVSWINTVFADAFGVDADRAVGLPFERIFPEAWGETLRGALAAKGSGASKCPPSGETALQDMPQRLILERSDGVTRQYCVEAGTVEKSSLRLLAVKALGKPQRASQQGRASKTPSSLAAARAANPLSPREREVLVLIAEGGSSKSIAERLGISRTTVNTYRRQIMNKLSLRTIAQLTKYAVRQNLAPP